MGYSIEISKIKNAEAQQLAQGFDSDKNGRLEGPEIGNYLRAQINETYVTDTISVNKTEAPTKAEENRDEHTEKAFFRELEDTVKAGGTRQQIIERLHIQSGKNVLTNSPELKASLIYVLGLMPEEYANSKEVDSKHKEIENAIKDAGFKDLEKDILKQLEKMAKNECKAKAEDKVEDDYLAKIQEFEKNGITGKDATPQKVMEAVKADAKKNGTFKDEYKDAFESLEKNGRMVEAMMLVYKAIDQVEDQTNGKKVQEAARDYLKANNQWDKYTEKALWGDKNIFKKARNTIIGRKSDGRILSDNQARENKVNDNLVQTDKEVQDKLGKRYHFLIKMSQAHPELVSYNKETGEWNLEGLSKAIHDQVGANYKLDRTIGAHKEISERDKTTEKLNLIASLQKEGMKWGDVKALVKLCGYDIEGKHWGRIIAGGLLGAAGGAGTTAAASAGAAAATKNQILLQENKISHDLELRINGDFSNVGDITGLPDGAQITQDKTGILISIHQLVTKPEQLVNLPKHIAKIATLSALPGALLGGAFGALAASKDKPEEPILSNNFEEKTLEEYLERESNNKYSTVVKLLATSFIDPKTGKWDREGYKDFLNTMGGNGGIINREELLGGILERLEKIEDKVDDDENIDDGNHEEEVKPEEHTYNKKETKQDHYDDVPTIDGSKTGWEQIANQYDCLKNRPLAEKTRILKIVQAINNGDYSTENIERLLKLSMSKKGTAHMKGVEGIDWDVYDNVIRATYLGTEVKVPPSLMGCERDASRSLKVGKSAPAKKPVAPKGSAKDRYYTGSTYTYYARYDGGAWVQYGSMKQRDDAVNDFIKKHPNATVEKKKEN